MALLLWGALAAGCVWACAPRPRTQVTVIIDAEPGIRRDAVQLRVRVEGGRSELTLLHEYPVGSEGEPVAFPVDVALVPLANDVTRRFRIAVTALDAEDVELGTVRALSSFVPEQTVTLRLVLEECCRSIRCGPEQTCRSCECTDDVLEPGLDAGTSDARALLPDAWAPDAGAPPTDIDAAAGPDARTGAPCARTFGCVDLGGPSVSVDTELGTRLWTRPLAGTCPVGPAAGSYGYDIFRIHNSTAARSSVTLDTSGSTVDAFLALYVDPSPDFTREPDLPADPGECIVALDDTAGASPQVSASFTFEPGETALAVITTSAPDTLGTARLGFTIAR